MNPTPPASTPAPPAHGRWRRFSRRCVRATCVTGILVVCGILAVGAYLSDVGLPGFAKTKLLEKLHAQGIELSFDRMRWRFGRGIVAENVHFGRADAPPDSPRFSAHEVVLGVNAGALLRGNLVVEALRLRAAGAVWHVGSARGAAGELAITNIQTELRFPAPDQWELDHFTAEFAGARIHLAGSLTNASALRDWPVFRAPAGQRPGRLEPSLNEFAGTLQRLQFAHPPEIELTVRGDGRDPQSFAVELTARAREARTPWGRLTNAALSATLPVHHAPGAAPGETGMELSLQADTADTPWGELSQGTLNALFFPLAVTNAPRRGTATVRAVTVRTPWGGARNLRLDLQATNQPGDAGLVLCRLVARADRFASPWAGADSLTANVAWAHSFTNAIPLEGGGEFALNGVQTRWGTARTLALTARMATAATDPASPPDPAWGGWAPLAPYALDWNCRLKDVRQEDWRANELALGGGWRAPRLTITNLTSQLFGGNLSLAGDLDVATRELNFNATTDCDAHQMAPLLPAAARRQLAELQWTKPPRLAVAGQVVLPAWTDAAPDWAGSVWSSLRLAAEVSAGPTAYRKVAVRSLHTRIGLTNSVWTVGELDLARPEGGLHLAGTLDQRTWEYALRLRSSLNPAAARPLVERGVQVVLDNIVCRQPPIVEGELRGRGLALSNLTATAHLAATNVLIRRESADNVQADLRYDHQLLEVTDLHVERQGRHAQVPLMLVDFPARRLFLTNCVSNVDPVPLLHIIGPVVTATMAPYQFARPPEVRVSGIIPLSDGVPADLNFHIRGGPFHWTRFDLNEIETDAHWKADRLVMTGTRTEFYGGRLTGSAAFDFSAKLGTDFKFGGTISNVDLHPLIAAAFLSPSNQLAGRLDGALTITAANSDDWNSWFGQGSMELRDGFIWEIPLFGTYSKLLDTISPGLQLGESRATSAAAQFTITNSVVRSGNLEIRARGVRMNYRGTVDFDGRTEAVVEAAILKGTPVIGPVVSLLLSPITKVFEYKVRGTLSDPQAEPLYVPKVLMDLLHPIGTLKKLLPGGGGNPSPAPGKAP